MNDFWETILTIIAKILILLGLMIPIIALNIAISYWQADGNWKCVFTENPAVCQNINKIGEKMK